MHIHKTIYMHFFIGLSETKRTWENTECNHILHFSFIDTTVAAYM